MFNWLNFLSYAVVTAVTPGPNNIMSMSNAGRLGLRRSFPFNLGIGVGFSAVMIICTFFCNMLSDIIPAIKTPMLFIGAIYAMARLENVKKFFSDRGKYFSERFYLRRIVTIYKSKNLYILYHVYGGIHTSILSGTMGSSYRICPLACIYRFFVYIMLGFVWFNV